MLTCGEYEVMSSNNYEIEFKFLIKISGRMAWLSEALTGQYSVAVV